MLVQCECNRFFHAKPSPCPKGNAWCFEHYAPSSFICPNCGKDHSAIISAMVDQDVFQKLGMSAPSCQVVDHEYSLPPETEDMKISTKIISTEEQDSKKVMN